MRGSALFCLAVSFAMFGFGLSLKCFSCPEGTTTKCEVEQECSQDDDACIKVTDGAMTYTSCMRYTDCSFNTLANRYPLPSFTFNCCKMYLCNHQEKSYIHFMMKKITG